MDKDVLVKSGHALVSLLDQTRIKPRAAMWVYNPDNDIWRLWVVCPRGTKEPEFYRIVADAIAKHRDALPGLDISSVELADEGHPAMKGMGRFLRMEGLGSANFSNNRMDGFYLPDGIVLRMAL